MDTLVSTQWLAEALGAPDLVVVDATKHLPGAGRDERAEYLAGHIPGARFLDIGSLVDATSPVPSALPRPDQLAERLASLGVSPSTRVVFYDDSAVKTAARAWYLAHVHGMQQVAVLDGGLAKWKAEERALESGEPAIAPAPPFELQPPACIRFKSDMLGNVESGAEQVVDARDGGRFSGETVDTIHNLPTGHIPGSRNLPFTQLYNADGTFRSRDQLRELFDAAGIDPARPVTATCGSGVTACVLLLAIHLLGHSETALYDGSWSDWGSDPATPKATGAAQ
ncbi:sulfurtransferase [Altererythrobacter arenosus]|uniref:Sulfurtransferase n=1 Tax=Altererythrobacter arenosus TaxID=3032592 RepID=A0ABY8FUM9_9SPHN|nr:sulfurtransferase [Altererythrobacter sp. CAU 1644]WFL77965.1 sulfurtransferase [Altererythrobacter sp. CAU 1644]